MKGLNELDEAKAAGGVGKGIKPFGTLPGEAAVRRQLLFPVALTRSFCYPSAVVAS